MWRHGEHGLHNTSTIKVLKLDTDVMKQAGNPNSSSDCKSEEAVAVRKAVDDDVKVISEHFVTIEDKA